MATNRRFAVQYQNYVTLPPNGGPPVIEMRPQWVELPANAPNEPGMVVVLGGQPGYVVQSMVPLVPALPVVYAPPMIVSGPIAYQRPDPSGQMATFTIPWHNPQVGARQWDPTKPMPVADWYAQNLR